MRNWQPHRRKPSLGDVLPVMKSNSNGSKPCETTMQMINGDYHQGPELLLRVVNASSTSLNKLGDGNGRFSGRFHSFSSSGSQLRARQKVWNSSPDRIRNESPLRSLGYCIPLSDIVVADIHDDHLLFLTTQKNGYFEFSFDSKNARDMMVAFLTASVQAERITTTSTGREEHSRLAPICSFDVEMLTNNRIQDHVKQETLSEKVKRKVVHVALQIGESEYHVLLRVSCAGVLYMQFLAHSFNPIDIYSVFGHGGMRLRWLWNGRH